jgi:hypothetical protein
MLDKLHSGVNNNAVDHEFNFNESTKQHIQKKEEKFIDQYINVIPESTNIIFIMHYELMDKSLNFGGFEMATN